MAGAIVNPYSFGGPTYDPTTFPFKHLWWADGPAFKAKGYANGGNVTQWPCEITGLTADQLVPTNTSYADSIPTYSANSGLMNGEPSVTFGTGMHNGMSLPSLAAFSDAASMNSGTNPSRGMAAAWRPSTSSVDRVAQSVNSSGADAWAPKFRSQSSGTWVDIANWYPTPAAAAGRYSSTLAISVMLVDSTWLVAGENEAWFNGVSPGAGATTSAALGTLPYHSWSLGGTPNSTEAFGGELSFFGIYTDSSGNRMKDHADFVDLSDWFSTSYGYELIA